MQKNREKDAETNRRKQNFKKLFQNICANSFKRNFAEKRILLLGKISQEYVPMYSCQIKLRLYNKKAINI